MPKTYAARRDRRREPTHPGAVLRDIVLPDLKIGVSEAARQLRGDPAGLASGAGGRRGRVAGNGGQAREVLRERSRVLAAHAERP